MSDGLSWLKVSPRRAIRDDSTTTDDWDIDVIPRWEDSPAPEEAASSAVSHGIFTIREVRVRGKDHPLQSYLDVHADDVTEVTFAAPVEIEVSSAFNRIADDYWSRLVRQDFGRYFGGSHPLQAVVGVGGVGGAGRHLAGVYPMHFAGAGPYLSGYHSPFAGGTWMLGDADQASARDDTDVVADAAAIYQEAFSSVLGIRPVVATSAAEVEGETVWRLTLVVPSKLLENIEQLVELESEAHSIVSEKSPDVAGFFSIHYVASDGDASANP